MAVRSPPPPSEELEALYLHLADQRWRLDNLYYIVNKRGEKQLFQMNREQRRLLDHLHTRNVILKARQIGFTTFIQIYMLDVALFCPDTKCGVIAQTMDIAQTIFAEKIKYPYDNLPAIIRQMVPVLRSNTTELHLANNSTIRVNTSMRGTTLSYLHVSEYGKICATSPEKSREIRTGALQTVGEEGFVFIESTAEGQEGHFYELCQRAQIEGKSDAEISARDWRFHFFPWWEHAEYSVANPETIVIPKELTEYLDRVEGEIGRKLTPGQRAFYAQVEADTSDDMSREYPATPEEAFAASIEGAYYASQMARIDREQRVRDVPYDPLLDVETWWDLGVDDETAIVFVQRHGREIRVIDYYANSGEGLAHYAKTLRDLSNDRGYRYARHVMPHDIAVRELGTGKTRQEVAETMGIRPIEVAPKMELGDGIEAVRNLLSRCYFDLTRTAPLVKALRKYRKAWDAKREVFRSMPLHDENSHPADAFRYGAVAPEPISFGFSDGPLKGRKFATA